MILKVDAENRIIYLDGPVSLDELLEQLEMIDTEEADWVIMPDMVFHFSKS